MPAPLQITLTPEEDRTLSELRMAQTVPQRTRDRAHMLRLNAQGWTVAAIADIFNRHEHTVRSTIERWRTRELGGLWEASGRGAKRKWQEADMQDLEQCLEAEQRTYNSQQLSTRHAQQSQQDTDLRQVKQADLETLELAAKEGHIDLKYLDEAGFCLYSPVSYSYSRMGQQKRLEQVPTRGNRTIHFGTLATGLDL